MASQEQANISAPMKVVVMTGGNVGIGFECAKIILGSQPNTHLILGCRNRQRAEQGIKGLEAFAIEGTTIEYRPLDLASFGSVRSFAEDIISSFPQGVHTLVLNAGLMVFTRKLTEDNHETNMQPGVGRGKGPELTIENVDGSVDFDGMVIYRNTKLCQAMCMHVLAASLKSDDGITVNAVCPGFIPTTDLKRDSGFATRMLMDNVLSRISAASTVQEGGARVYSAMAGQSRTKNGAYYSKDGEDQSSEESRDPEKQKLWWNWSCQAVGLESLSR